jgi:hypothetical protein
LLFPFGLLHTTATRNSDDRIGHLAIFGTSVHAGILTVAIQFPGITDHDVHRAYDDYPTEILAQNEGENEFKFAPKFLTDLREKHGEISPEQLRQAEQMMGAALWSWWKTTRSEDDKASPED